MGYIDTLRSGQSGEAFMLHYYLRLMIDTIH
jgi:hypothetical protein